MASTRLTKVYGSSGNRRTYTLSAWVKRSGLDSHQDIISAYRSTDGLQTDVMRFQNDNKFQFYMHTTSGGTNAQLSTIRRFRDTNAWYHIVTRVDTTQSTASDRVRIYINGVLQDAFSTETYPDQNEQSIWGLGDSNVTHTIGAVGSSNYLDGYLSHVHYADGQSLAPTVFGETDSTTGEWKIKTNPSFTLGTNGFTILKDGNTITDQSSNSNDFTLGAGTLTKSEDNPSNLFATLNSLVRTASTPTFSQGNNTVAPNAGAYQNHFSTIGMTGGGKYYWEMKVNGSPNSANYHGVSSDAEFNNLQTVSNVVGYTSASYCLVAASGNKYNNTNSSSYGSALANGDIMMGALDLDNGKIWYGKNGTWFNSGDPAGGSNEAFSSISASNTYFVSGTVYNGGFTSINFNFGNGYFGTTAVASAGTNASNNGIFEYDVPTGFTALSTKGLNL